MESSIYLITGRITREDKEIGIHGLLVTAWDYDNFFDNGLGQTLTHQDGSFAISFNESTLGGRFEGPLEVYIKIRDRDGNLIHNTKRHLQTCLRGEPLDYRLALPDKVLERHFSRPLSWERPTGRLAPQAKMKQIEAAISLIAHPGEPDHTTFRQILDCLRPPIDWFDNVLMDAWQVLQGDLSAAARFRDILETIWAQRLRHYSTSAQQQCERLETFFTDEGLSELTQLVEGEQRVRSGDSFFADENGGLLIMASLHLAGGQRAKAARYAGVVFEQLWQLCRFKALDVLHRAAVRAPGGGSVEREHFQDVLNLLGSEFGPDCGPMPPFPSGMPQCCFEPVPPPKCVADAAVIWKNNPIPNYVISDVKPSRACPGDTITITGNGFGNVPGQVLFRVWGSGIGTKPNIAVNPTSWSDREVTVGVPAGVGSGLSLSVPPETVTVCGRCIDRVKLGTQAADFEGTAAEILYFMVNSGDKSICIEPEVALNISWNTSAADKVRVEILSNSSSVVASQDPAAKIGTWSYIVTKYSNTTQLKVRLTAEGKCQPPKVEKTIDVMVWKQANLSIQGVEVTQAIQYYRAEQHLTDINDRGPDNSLQLVENKPAWVRVYLRSGQDPSFDGGQLHNIDGTLTVERQVGGAWSEVTTLNAINAPYSAQESFPNYAAERSNINATLNFTIPPYVMSGLLRLTVNASSTDECTGGDADYSVTVDARLHQKLQVAALRIGYDGPNAAGTANVQEDAPPLNGAGANTVAAECQFALTIFPVSSKLNLRGIGVKDATAPLNNAVPAGGCDPNWTPIINLVAKARTNDGNKAGWIYYGFVTQNIPRTHGNTGCASGTNAAGIIDDGRTFAHEAGHQMGMAHAPCGAVGTTNKAFPQFEPYDTGLTTTNAAGDTVWHDASTGEYGLNINNGDVLDPNNSEDYMSYCGPRWVSIYSHKHMANNPTLIPTKTATGFSAGAGNEIPGTGIGNLEETEDDAPRALITITGYIDENGKVTDMNVARMEVRQPSIDGRITEYIAELMNEEGNPASSAFLFTLPQHWHTGASGGCCNEGAAERIPAQPPFYFIAVLEDVAVGKSLRIRKEKEIVWQKDRPRRKPEIGQVKAALDKDQRLKLSWDYEVPAEDKPEVWLRWSIDQGENWNGLTVGIRKDSADLDIDDLPAGEIIFQVLSHDGFYTISRESQSVRLPERAPMVSILHPREESPISANIPLRLSGSVSIRSLNVLKEDDYIWYIDDEEVGRGIDIWVNNPGIGKHQIKFMVDDPAGQVVVSTSIEVIG
jgi:hypothetical protein